MAEPVPGPILSVRDLVTEVATSSGRRTVVDRLSFDVAAGETLCIAGESGSGKSSLALSILRMIKPPGRIEAGEVWLAGTRLADLNEEGMRERRLADIALVPQSRRQGLGTAIVAAVVERFARRAQGVELVLPQDVGDVHGRT